MATKTAKKPQGKSEGSMLPLIICLVAALAIILAIAAAIIISMVNDPAPEPIDMTQVIDEINSMKVTDFTETTKTTDYVKISVKDHGDMVVRLREGAAPITVKNFQNLVGQKFYDGLTFHRVMQDFMIQGGDPEGDGTGNGPTTIKGEFSANGVQNDLKHIKGVISMARGGHSMDSASCQFFICNANSASVSGLDGSYASFGYVVAGLEVVDSISAIKVTATSRGEMSIPAEKVIIEKICFVEKK